jgi:hypothetical protein
MEMKRNREAGNGLKATGAKISWVSEENMKK